MALRYSKYNLAKGLHKVKTRTAIVLSAVTLVISGGTGLSLLSFGAAHAATPVTVYNNVADPQPYNVPSVGFEATSTDEFGGQIGLAGSERENPTVTVLMSSWACQDGNWTNGCTTTSGATFTHPVTLNVYAVNADNSVGSLITSDTQTFTMPYRPSSDGCGSDATAWTAADNSCNHGLSFPISFNLSGVTLPDHVILAVAYNTSHYGSNPIGTSAACYSTPAGCPYDSLNVGTSGNPTTGTALPTSSDAYLNSSWAGAYCDGTLGTGTFRLDAGCWSGYLPAFTVTASAPEPVLQYTVSGGGHISEQQSGKHKNWYDVSLGLDVSSYNTGTTGTATVQFHNTSNSTVNKTAFHADHFTSFNYYKGVGDCDAAVNFTAVGTWNGHSNYKAIVRAGDNMDTVRVTLMDGSNHTVYDTMTDFAQESACVGTVRTNLDNGNLVIEKY